MRDLIVSDLPILNLVLSQKPVLALSILKALEELEASIAALRTGLAPVQGTLPGIAKAAPDPIHDVNLWEDKILLWFKANPVGRHKLGKIREDLHAPSEGEPGAKAFKTALHRAISTKRVKSTGLRGPGAAYWAA